MINATFAEYRAFQLEIQNQKTKQKRIEASQLDPDQYIGFFPLAKDESIKYTATWMCYGNTAYSDRICLNPRPEIPTKILDKNPSLNIP